MHKFKKPAIFVGFTIFTFVVLILSLLMLKLDKNVRLASVEDPVAYYSVAKEKLSDCSNMQLIVSTFEIIRTKENEFQTSKQQNITYLNRNSNDLQLSAAETIDMGRHTIQASVVYSDNALYYTLNDSNFTGSSNPETLSAQYPPLTLLDPDAYQNIAGLQVGDSTVILFSSPRQPETWTGIDAANFLDAQGCAWVDGNGNLVKSTYNLCYTEGDFTFYRSVTVRIADLDPAPITVPTNTDDFVRLSDPLLPLQLELACGYLLQPQNITANHIDTITSQLFGDTRVQNIDILVKNGANSPVLEMTTLVNITNNSREGEVFTSKQMQLYDNGNYTLITNDDPAVTTQGTSSQELLTVCQEVLIGTILLPKYIQNAEITHSEDTYRIEFTANDEFAQKIISDACTTLYDDPQLLDKLSAEHSVDKIMGYLECNADSGLPVKTGIHFLGTYYSSDLPYQLSFESDQTYLIP